MRPAVLALLACTACASGYNPAGQTTEQTVRVVGTEGTIAMATSATTRPRVATIEIPAQTVWRELPAAYRALGMEIGMQDAARQVVGNPGFRARRRLGDTPISRYLDCGRAQGGPSADTYEVHFSVLSELTSDTQGRTIISTVIDATARPINFSGDPVRCSSTGELESRLVEHVRKAGQG